MSFVSQLQLSFAEKGYSDAAFSDTCGATLSASHRCQKQSAACMSSVPFSVVFEEKRAINIR